MKAKFALLIISICVLIALLPLNGIVTMAESDIESLEPNSYEKKDFKEKSVQNVEKVIGVEIFCAAQALDFHRRLKSSRIMSAIHDHVRSKIDHITKDGVMNEVMETAIEMVRNKELIQIARQTADKEGISLDTEFSNEFDEF